MVNLSADNAQRLKKLSVGSLGTQFSVTRSKTAAGMRAKVCNLFPGEIGSTQKRIDRWRQFSPPNWMSQKDEVIFGKVWKCSCKHRFCIAAKFILCYTRRFSIIGRIVFSV